MEIGIPMSLQARTVGQEIVFNDLRGSGLTTLSGEGVVFPSGLPADNGFLVQRISGLDGAAIRNPVDPRPHKSGGIMHTFRRGPRVFTIEGLIVATTRGARTTMEDWLRGISDRVLAADGRFFIVPSGQATRFMTVRLYEPVSISIGGQLPGPKTFELTLVSVDAAMYTYAQDVTNILTTGILPNLGNTDSWPVLQVLGPSVGFTVSNDRGFSLSWTGTLAAGHLIEIDMFKETMFVDGNGANVLSGLDLVVSDFWSVPPGGTTVSFVNALGGTASLRVLSNSAWV